MKNDNKLEQNLQYEVIHPITGKTLNKSLCEDTIIDVYVPFNVENEEIYNNLIDQGYDPLDLNDKFYREICTQYNSENGTDVLLDDREEYIYSTIESEMSCPSGCQRSSYSLDDKYITCECDSNDNGIVPLDVHHLSGKNILNSVLSTLK